MKEENNIESLFKDSFKDFEVDAGPNTWNKIQSSVQSGVAGGTAASSASSWISSIIVGVGITGIAIGGYYFFDSKAEKSQAQNSIEQTIEQGGDDENVKIPVLKSDPSENDQVEDRSNNGEFNSETEDYERELIEKDQIQSNNQKPNSKNIDEEKRSPKNEQQSKVEENNWTNNSINAGDKVKDNSDQIVKEEKSSTPIKNDMEHKNASVNEEQTAPEQNAPEAYSANTMTDQETEEVNIELIKELPNVFSPNYNGTNDEIIINAAFFNHADEIHFALFDKSNDIIYETRGTEIRFDGIVNGSMLEKNGLYYYVVYVSYKGKRKNFKPVGLTVK